jgi:hypothetical protein
MYFSSLQHFQIVLKKREPLNYLVPDGSAGFSSRLAATQDMMSFIQPSVSVGPGHLAGDLGSLCYS